MAIKPPSKTPARRDAAKAPVKKTAKPAAPAKSQARKAPPAPAAVKPAVAPASKPGMTTHAAAKPVKLKAKLVRDSFTMPQSDFDLIGALKARALDFKRPAKKSELLRAGLQALSGLNDTALRAALDALAPLKPGRPKKAD
jgi:hypothetical protein